MDARQRQWMTLGDILREHRRSRPHALALVDGLVRLTYLEFDGRVNQVVGALRAQGVAGGDRVLWLGQNSFRVLELLLACAKLGATFVPVNWRQSAKELAFVISDLEPAVVFWQEEEIGQLVADARGLVPGGGARWVQHDGTGPQSYESLVEPCEDVDTEDPVDPQASVLGIYTAAFEGAPNCALLTHLGIFIENLTLATVAEISDETVFLNSGPMFHLGTLMTTLSTFHFGGANVILRRVEAAEICRLVEQERCTKAFIMAPTVVEIRECNSEGQWDVSSLWGSNDPATWGMCTPSMSPATGRAGGYGQSETVGLSTFYGHGRQSTSIYGRPLPTVAVRVLDAEGHEVPPGETGEIVMRGPTVMNEYFRRDELNAARQRGGWHHTGDLGCREADGSLRFVGPMMQMIKSASENVYPIEVERAILAHPAVADVCVIGVPDEKWTQTVKALVVLKDGGTATSAEIIDHCRAHIASYKKPRIVEFVAQVPRTAAGALDRDQADLRFGGGNYPGRVSSGKRDVTTVT